MIRHQRSKVSIAGIFIFGLAIGVSFAQTSNNGSVRQEIIIPLAQEVEVNEDKAELGKKLWFDPRLSKSGFISLKIFFPLGVFTNTKEIPISSSISGYVFSIPQKSPIIISEGLLRFVNLQL